MGVLHRIKSLGRTPMAYARYVKRQLGIIARPREAWDGVQHQAFEPFGVWEGTADGKHLYDFLGVRTDVRYRVQWKPHPAGPFRAKIPSPFQGYFEMVAVLESVLESKDAEGYCIVELGAGHGPWLVLAHRAMALVGDVPVRLLGVEMVPQHFDWLHEHLRGNGIVPEAHKLLRAAAGDRDGEIAYIPEPDPLHDFGQRVDHAAHVDDRDVERVPLVTLPRLIEDVERVDLLHIDIQGEEFRVLSHGIEAANAKVRRLVIGTHSRSIERRTRALLHDHGWQPQWDFRGGGRRRTEFGDVTFVDGLQVWLNPRLAPLTRRVE